MGATRSQVERALIEAGVPVLRPLDIERVVEMYRSGMGMVSIAAELHVNHRRVGAALREAGVVMRRSGSYPRRVSKG